MPERLVQKAELEVILQKLLNSLKSETFQSVIKAIGEKIWAVLDVTGSGKVDLGMFFAMIAPICAGPMEKRMCVVFDALLWRSMKDAAKGQVTKLDVAVYMRYLRPFSDMKEICEGEENAMISFLEFVEMFDDIDHGFGIMSTLVKLEGGDKPYQDRHSCRVCRYQITGLMFKEMTSRFWIDV